MASPRSLKEKLKIKEALAVFDQPISLEPAHRPQIHARSWSCPLILRRPNLADRGLHHDWCAYEGPMTAVLGPTNTGKTFLAIERMLGHATGMIGFPLRLLARENYDKVVRQKGVAQVALVTGEEKIIPRDPRYWICTVEAMPLDVSVAFLAIDEVQPVDPERGYVFTDRLLHARGTMETMFMGSDTMAGVIGNCCPTARSKPGRAFPNSATSHRRSCRRCRGAAPSWCSRRPMFITSLSRSRACAVAARLFWAH